MRKMQARANRFCCQSVSALITFHDASAVQLIGHLFDSEAPDPEALGRLNSQNQATLPATVIGLPVLSRNDKGLDLLTHEAAHAWQYQHGGPGYITQYAFRIEIASRPRRGARDSARR